MTKNEKQYLQEVFERIQNQFKFFENDIISLNGVKNGIQDICQEASDDLKNGEFKKWLKK